MAENERLFPTTRPIESAPRAQNKALLVVPGLKSSKLTTRRSYRQMVSLSVPQKKIPFALLSIYNCHHSQSHLRHTRYPSSWVAPFQKKLPLDLFQVLSGDSEPSKGSIDYTSLCLSVVLYLVQPSSYSLPNTNQFKSMTQM